MSTVDTKSIKRQNVKPTATLDTFEASQTISNKYNINSWAQLDICAQTANINFRLVIHSSTKNKQFYDTLNVFKCIYLVVFFYSEN